MELAAAPRPSSVNSPIRWVGGKSRLRKHILPLLPAHICYVEPFGGGASVLLGKKKSKVEVFNDIDEELMNFFRIVKQMPEDFLEELEWELVSRAEFNRLADLDPRTLDPLPRARRFFYLIMGGWGGESNYPRFQTSINDGGHGNRLIGALKTLRQRILPVHERLKTVIIENLPWDAILERYDSDGTLFYLDPPYPGNGVNYAHNMPSWSDHQHLAARLAQLKGKWIVSSYDRPEVRMLYGGSHIVPIESASGMASAGGRGRTTNQEILVCNFIPIPIQEVKHVR